MPILMVKAREVLPNDEIVERFPDGKIQRFIPVAGISFGCCDRGNIHLSLRTAPRFKSPHHDSSLKTECWFGETEVEVKRG